MRKTSPLILLAAMSLFVAPLAACDDGAEAGETDETSGTDSASGDGDGDATGDGDGDAGGVDEAAVIASAMDYQNWVLINAAPFTSAGHDGGAAVVNIYVPADIADQYRAIDPANPAATTFPEGSIIVKEHVDENNAPLMATVMAKGPDGFSESGNWWWGAGDLLGGTLGMTGQLEGCIGCHGPFAETDWLIGVPAAEQTAP